MNASIRLMLLLTAQSFSILLLGFNAIYPFPQSYADLLVYISSPIIGWTVTELMFWDLRTGAKQ